MSPIPSSDLPGHRRLHERTLAALGRCQEDQDVDFKQSAAWDHLKWRITHAALGMGNLRDGGIVVVGVSEQNNKWTLTGIDASALATYEPDIIADHINAYASPHIDLDVVTVSHDGRIFLSILCKEFRDTPIVCKKNGPADSGVVEGRVYVRPPGLPKTTAITSASQMHALLELAAEKRARAFMEMAHRVGATVATPPTGGDHFKTELRGL